MMGFGEEEGVIPRFCDELFSKLASMENKEVKSLGLKAGEPMCVLVTSSDALLIVVLQVKCHVEMSYFEVYNEKIHDLLVVRDEPNCRRMPVSRLSLRKTPGKILGFLLISSQDRAEHAL